MDHYELFITIAKNLYTTFACYLMVLAIIFTLVMIVDEWYTNGFRYAMGGYILLILAFVLPWLWPIGVLAVMMLFIWPRLPDGIKNWLMLCFIAVFLISSKDKNDAEEYHTGY